jgi:signal transduction histidine kinase
VSGEFRQLDDRRRAIQGNLAALPAAPDIDPGARLGWRIFEYQSRPWRNEAWAEIDFGELVDFDAVALVPAHLATPDFAGPGYGFPVRFRIDAFGLGAQPLTIADFTRADFPKPGDLPVWLPAAGSRARRIRLTVTQPWQLGQGLHACALGEIMVLRGHRNLATGRRDVTVRTSDSRESPPAWSRENLVDGLSVLGAPLGPRLVAADTIGHGWHSQLSRRADTVKWVQIDLGRAQPLDEVRLVPARLPQRLHHEGYGFPLRFRVEASDDPDFAQPHLLADYTAAPFSNPGFSAVTIPAGLTARYVRVPATELQHRGDGQYHFALAELQAYVGDRNVALGAPVSFLDNLEAGPNWRPVYLTDGARWENRLGEWPAWLRGLSDRRERLAQLSAVEHELAELRPGLTRLVAWTLAGLAVAAALALLAGYYRLQLRRSREADALRRRIAADLHDDLGSNLASIALLSEICLQARAPVPHADLAELHALARETAGALRDITWFIRPDHHTQEQFLERLRATVRRLLAGVTWTFEADTFIGTIALDAQRHLLLALKETLHNVVRHASARHVQIRLSATPATFTLEVTDDGSGMDPTAIPEGQGFASLRHRAQLLGGDTQIRTAPGQGTTVTFTGRLTPKPTLRHV